MKTLTTKEKMLKVLKANKGRNAFTTAQARNRFKIVGVRQRIHDLRNDGYMIKSTTKYVRGRPVTAYKLVA